MKHNTVLIAFYSRTGVTKKVALRLKELYGFDTEEIIDLKERGGALNYILGGKDAMQEKETDIKEIEKDVSKYDLVIIATPVWASNMAPAVRTYINKLKDKINNVAFICTEGGSGAEKTFSRLEGLVNKKSEANLVLLTREVNKGDYDVKLKEFTDKI